MSEILEETKFHIRGIPAPLIDKMWPFAEPYIKRALDHTNGELLPSDLKNFCQDRDAQLWLITTENRVIAAVTTEIVTYPQRKHCRIITFAGSNSQDWTEEFNKVIEAWATEKGCDAIEASVRKGYVQKLEQHGFKYRYSSIIKEINYA